MEDAYIGSIVLFAGNYPPRGWEYCSGQLIAISSNQSLYAVIGTVFGGDGRTTFGLPDLRSRVPAHVGTGPGLSTLRLGQIKGSETNTLTTAQMPSHGHELNANSNATDRSLASEPTNNYAGPNSGTGGYATSTNAKMNRNVVAVTGGGQSVNNIQPTLGLNYIICVQGLFPPRH